MSMPSSRLEVATTAGSRPALSASSIWLRSCRDTEPWWARATSAGAPAADARLGHQLGWHGRPSAPGPSGPPGAVRVAGRWRAAAPVPRPVRRRARSAGRRAVRPGGGSWRTRSWTGAPGSGPAPAPRRAARSSAAGAGSPRLVRAARRAAACPAGPARGPSAGRPCPRPGTTIRSSSRFSLGGATIVTGRAPPRNVATSSGGRTVADSPIRWAGPAVPGPPAVRPRPVPARRPGRPRPRPQRVQRSSDSARCAPRLPPASACTSSMITVSTPRSASRACEVSSRNSDSGRGDQDVRRLAGQLAALVGGGVAGPHRRPGYRARAARAGGRPADAGQRRAEVPLDVHGQRLQRRDVQHPAALPGIWPGPARWRACRSPTGTRPASCPSR